MVGSMMRCFSRHPLFRIYSAKISLWFLLPVQYHDAEYLEWLQKEVYIIDFHTTL
jgi:hypothetical protein